MRRCRRASLELSWKTLPAVCRYQAAVFARGLPLSDALGNQLLDGHAGGSWKHHQLGVGVETSVLTAADPEGHVYGAFTAFQSNGRENVAGTVSKCLVNCCKHSKD